MREITDHEINPANGDIRIIVQDEPGPGGANHHYELAYPKAGGGPRLRCFLTFQNGPVTEAGGVNGITQEALIAVCIDRLRAFQAGEFACRENAIALTHLEDALHWLHHRTRARQARGVEGTLVP